MSAHAPPSGPASSHGRPTRLCRWRWSAVRVLVLALVILVRAASSARWMPTSLRADRIATSPATPYRNFPVGVHADADGGRSGARGRRRSADAAARIALLAFVADLAAAVALAWGWGRRPAATYLLLGLPLLSFIYLRFDLVSVALAAWALALLRRRSARTSAAPRSGSP